MDDLEQQIHNILSDPEQMKRVAELAQSIGLPIPETMQPEDNDSKEDAVQVAAPTHESTPPKQKTRSEELLRALKPFLKPNRQKKLEQALQLAQLSRIAGTVFPQNHSPEP